MSLHLPSNPSKTESVVWLLAMMSRPGGVQAATVKRELGIDPRTLRRYVEVLRGMDLVVELDGRGDTRRLLLRNATFSVTP